MIHHPDRGGDTATMAAINAEYEALFPVLKLAYNRTAETPTTETAESTRSEFYTRNGWKGRSVPLIRKFIKEYLWIATTIISSEVARQSCHSHRQRRACCIPKNPTECLG